MQYFGVRSGAPESQARTIQSVTKRGAAWTKNFFKGGKGSYCKATCLAEGGLLHPDRSRSTSPALSPLVNKPRFLSAAVSSVTASLSSSSAGGAAAAVTAAAAGAVLPPLVLLEITVRLPPRRTARGSGSAQSRSALEFQASMAWHWPGKSMISLLSLSVAPEPAAHHTPAAPCSARRRGFYSSRPLLGESRRGF